MADKVNKALDPYTDGSGYTRPSSLDYGMNFKDFGSYGLRQFGGWVREEFLPQLVGQQGARVYREMLDNSATIGAMIFAITQAMRKVAWRIEPVDDSAKAVAYAEFVDTLRLDMSHTWEDFIAEALSMLGYGYSFHELVYKRRMGPQSDMAKFSPRQEVRETPGSRYNDGLIGWRRLPIRGQDTILKWFFDQNGQVRGVTQQPWVGTLIDIPIEKGLLFRPSQHKNNPEGRSVLRNAYRSYYFIKRLEELEAILFERMAGFPVMYVPSKLIDEATAPGPNGQINSAAAQTLASYKRIVTNIRIDEQMGAVLPSDTYRDGEGKPTSVKMFDFQLVSPNGSKGSGMDSNQIIQRHQLEILMTVLSDFIQMGHEVRGTNNLAMTKVDMFYAAIEGWLDNIAAPINKFALPRVWSLNGFDPNYMPRMVPDMPQRLDLDGLGGFINNLAAAGMPLFPDEDLQTYLREAASLPEITSPEATRMIAQQPGMINKILMGAVAKRIKEMRSASAK